MKTPQELDLIADVVLRYQPKEQQKKADKRARKLAKKAKKKKA